MSSERPSRRESPSSEQATASEQVGSIWEALDCCGSGANDLNQPEMRHLAQRLSEDARLREQLGRLQKYDAAVSAAMHDVAVPEQLLNYLLRITADLPPGDLVAAAQPDSADAPQLTTRSPSGLARRKPAKLLAIVSGLAVCLSLAVFAAIRLMPASAVGADRLATEAVKWVDALESTGWQSDVAAEPTRNYYQVLGLRIYPRRWQRINASPYDRQAMAYDLRQPGRPLAVLLALKTPAQLDVDRVLPPVPIHETRGFSVGICQRDGVLFVLVVKGNQQRYRQFFKPARIS